ncbi:oocyte-secreted protein 2 [Sciurus carolinensis]|uniref:oocyte-secreted protein 2 n=1 Tax=Sciurus carolinensis TaxID=30640 RepID=UPI001FB48E69|nr:oocyte-secreted protein 2 [Sciurus carolinensis]
MKAPGKLALILLAAVTLFGYSAPTGVKVYCSLTWLQVNLKALTIGDWYLLPDEAFLGYGCPVTNVEEDVYMFLYPTSDCGIQTRSGQIIGFSILPNVLPEPFQMRVIVVMFLYRDPSLSTKMNEVKAQSNGVG